MDYLYIRAWGKMLGSFPCYIEREVDKARWDHAPQSAIYRRQDGTWATFEKIERQDTKDLIASIVAQSEKEVRYGCADD